jgi:signal transduction histidine kinase
VERAQVSRQLHDGVIQSLIGIDMQMEVMRRQVATVGVLETTAQLESLQSMLNDEILNLRDLMQLLKPAKVLPERLVEHLTEEIAHFRSRTNIDVKFSCKADDIDLSPRVCHEIAAIVQEGLANVRKHSGATSALVRLERRSTDWLLTIDDNGHGFEFEGTWDHDQLDSQHSGPLIIKERLRSIGGRLSIQSKPGAGARLDMTIPGRHHG